MEADNVPKYPRDCEERADVSEEAAGLHEEAVGRSCWVLTEMPRILRMMVCSVDSLVRAQADWDVDFDMLEKQFLKALHRVWFEFHREVIINQTPQTLTGTLVAVWKPVGTV